MNSVALITARTESSRFPGKILENISAKKKSIDILISRAKKTDLPVILATTNLKSDDNLCKYVKKNHLIKIFRGSSKNKILRWHQCFKKFNIKKACLIDGDDLCFDYELYKKNIKINKRFEIMTYPKSIITGLFNNIISLNGLKKLVTVVKKNQDTEMIEPFIEKAMMKKIIIKINKKYINKKIRLTFDYKEDLQLFKTIYSKFETTIDSKDIIDFLIKNPMLTKINYFREASWKNNQIKKISDVKKLF